MEWSLIDILQLIVSIGTLAVACNALQTWKTQRKTEHITSFLDELTTEQHKFITRISAPVSMLNVIKIGIDSRVPLRENDPKHHKAIISYIQEHGREDAKRFSNLLNECENSYNQIKSLLIKGQIYNINQFDELKESCEDITKYYTGLNAFSIIIGHDTAYWKNPEVEDSLDIVNSVLGTDISDNIEKAQKKYVPIVQSNYKLNYN